MSLREGTYTVITGGYPHCVITGGYLVITGGYLHCVVTGGYLHCVGPPVVSQGETMAVGSVGGEGRVQGTVEGGEVEGGGGVRVRGGGEVAWAGD